MRRRQLKKLIKENVSFKYLIIILIIVFLTFAVYLFVLSYKLEDDSLDLLTLENQLQSFNKSSLTLDNLKDVLITLNELPDYWIWSVDEKRTVYSYNKTTDFLISQIISFAVEGENITSGEYTGLYFKISLFLRNGSKQGFNSRIISISDYFVELKNWTILFEENPLIGNNSRLYEIKPKDVLRLKETHLYFFKGHALVEIYGSGLGDRTSDLVKQYAKIIYERI